MNFNRKVAVVGLGYVGLPVAIAFSKICPVVAYDKNNTRIQELQEGLDRTGEFNKTELRVKNLLLTHEASSLATADFYIVAVPTPVDKANYPDLSLLINASQTIGKYLKKNDIVVFESTVYPGATEEDCVPALEASSGLKYKIDFTVGYSPERINPSDPLHKFENITKVVSGSDEQTLKIVSQVYGSVVKAGIYQAANISTAEAAKVIENTQRDLNIALMNELALIFHKMGIDTHDVLAAAATKWNFIPFTPGLVGGHCIGVDPYYLTYQAKRYGYHPQVILAGRQINDHMGKYIAEQTIKKLMRAGLERKNIRIGILGITFKENCPDIRNSKVVDIIQELETYKVQCLVHSSQADPAQVKSEYNIDLTNWADMKGMDALILAIPEKFYLKILPEEYARILINDTKIIIDVKAVLDRGLFAKHDIDLWRL